MKLLERNKTTFHYLLYKGKTPLLDEQGFQTGEETVTYADAVSMEANVSSASGYAQVEQFGNYLSYDKVIVTDDMSCPIDENTVLFIDKQPEYDKNGFPLYDYTVRKVAKGLNSISYAVARVTVS